MRRPFGGGTVFPAPLVWADPAGRSVAVAAFPVDPMRNQLHLRDNGFPRGEETNLPPLRGRLFFAQMVEGGFPPRLLPGLAAAAPNAPPIAKGGAAAVVNRWREAGSVADFALGNSRANVFLDAMQRVVQKPEHSRKEQEPDSAANAYGEE